MGNCILQSKRRNNDLRQRAEPFFSPFRLDLKAFLIFESIWPVFSLPRETGKGSSESFTGNHLNSWIVERQEESKEVLAIISQMKQGTMGFNWKLKPGAHLTWLWLPSGPCFTPLPFTAVIHIGHLLYMWCHFINSHTFASQSNSDKEESQYT
jgi:hypothetical protein